MRETKQYSIPKRAVIAACEIVKAVAIPKKNGGTHILGISIVEDRIAQMAAKLYFETSVESIFYESSYGYRPKKISDIGNRSNKDKMLGKGEGKTKRSTHLRDTTRKSNQSCIAWARYTNG